MEALYANSYGKIKSREKSLGKENEKNRPKEKRNSSTCQRKKKILAESDKGSWFGRKPSTISASADDPERSNILEARSLKSKSASVQVANKILRRNLAEAMKKKKNATLKVPNTGASILYRPTFSVAHYISGECFAFAFGVFAHYIASSS